MLVANSHKSELVSEILKKAGELVQRHVDAGGWRETKLLLRFLGGLQSIFEGDGIFPILEELFTRAVDLQTTSSEDVSECHLKRGWCALFDLLRCAVTWIGTCKNHSVYASLRDGIPRNWLRSLSDSSS